MPLTRLFALIIGIDNYKSGNIWNLHSCAEDAKKMKQWLTEEINVPREQICLLLDSHATKSNIEASFMEHLVNNPSIERGDAIFIYFAGHGSSMTAPSEWYQGEVKSEMVEVLCPYDHDTRTGQGRVAGISDRSFHAMIQDLAFCKGDNITVLLDSCFSPIQTPANILERSSTRWTKTTRATPEDLYRGLWSTARGKNPTSVQGFWESTVSYVSLLASSPGQKALENKDGGRFTANFLRAISGLPLHRTSYMQVMEHMQQIDEGALKYMCIGKHRERILFDSVPFQPDDQFLSAGVDEATSLIKVDIGAIQGIVQGTEFSLHLHNYQNSRNPAIATIIASDVQPHSCLARFKSRPCSLPTLCWARITRWNNRRPFRVYLKTSFISFFRTWGLRRALSTNGLLKTRFHIAPVKRPDQADVSLSVSNNSISVTTPHTSILAQTSPPTTVISDKHPIEVIEDAAQFDMHLSRTNADKPLHNLIDMEILRIDPFSWLRISDNYLKDGTATIPRDEGAIYQLNLHNKSKMDIWPSLLYMDPSGHKISTAYSSVPCEEAPLRSQGSLAIGSGESGSRALSFPQVDDRSSIRFLKMFFSSAPVSMTILQQNDPYHWKETDAPRSCISACTMSDTPLIWDTALVVLYFVEHSDSSSSHFRHSF